MSQRTLLIVDDEPALTKVFLRTLSRAFQAIDVAVKAFNDPYELLEEIEKNGAPLAIMTDDRMPGLSGRELAEELRRRGYAGTILMLSGTADETVLACGIDRLFTKPASLREIFDHLVERVFSPPGHQPSA